MAPSISDLSVNDKARFWRKVVIPDLDQCWPWAGYTDPQGYGTFPMRGHPVRATHVALTLEGFPRPHPKAFALHSCDNPRCVNPSHLRWGDVQDNADDRTRRARGAVGVKNARSKLTEEAVRYIRTSKETLVSLAAKFGVNHSQISKARRRVRWRHIP